MSLQNRYMILHSKMLLLTLLKANILWLLQRSLHSNMGLLKRRSRISLLYHPNFYIPNMFLLNHLCMYWCGSEYLHLHSTMFLLNLLQINLGNFQFLYLHSTMFLLNSCRCLRSLPVSPFTFHNVSIKTPLRLQKSLSLPDLHSTMFLLKPGYSSLISELFQIYIPQCFY